MPDITNFDCCQNGNRIEVEAAAITRQAGRQMRRESVDDVIVLIYNQIYAQP